MSKQQRYTPEFKAEAVKLVLEQGIQQSLSARQLGIPEGTLAGWVAAAKSATVAASVPGSRSGADLLSEVSKLRKELAEARMERDILKKATAYFAKESLHGTRS
jgi:transposase